MNFSNSTLTILLIAILSFYHIECSAHTNSKKASTSSPTTNWAVLIAGSNGYYNYRHQADVAHAYQILTQIGGFPKDKVIVMMYNDIVNNSQNPYPGQLFNEPGGHNVYEGINIDYSGDDVTAENFLNVLQGKKESTDNKPVLESSANDNVFVYYTDHGATGIVGMPTGDPLYADDLIAALNAMHENGMYKQLVFYLEACQSGSMFNKILPSNISVYATTAANPYESSYAYYYNTTLATYMADEYSIRWMQDTTNFWNYEYEILLQQYINVENAVTESHPQKYGDFNFDNETIEDFQAYDDRKSMHSSYKNKKQTVPIRGNRLNSIQSENDASTFRFSRLAADSRDVKLATLRHQFEDAKSMAERRYFSDLMQIEIKQRRFVDLIAFSIVKYLSGFAYESDISHLVYDTLSPTNFACLKQAYKTFEQHCFKFDEYSLKYVQTLVNMCEMYPSDDIFESIKDVCEEKMEKVDKN
jgi:legumain